LPDVQATGAVDLEHDIDAVVAPQRFRLDDPGTEEAARGVGDELLDRFLGPDKARPDREVTGRRCNRLSLDPRASSSSDAMNAKGADMT